MRCYSCFNPEEYSIDIWTPGHLAKNIPLEWFRERNINILEGAIDLSNPIRKRLESRNALKKLLRKKSYDVVHVNSSAAWLLDPALSIAKETGVSIRIAHSHAAGSKSALSLLMQKLEARRIGGLATNLVACSNSAGVFLFGKDLWNNRGILIRNGIEAKDYSLNPATRAAIRSGEQIADEDRVITCVGRLSKLKNQSYLIDLFSRIYASDPRYRLWLIGEGEMRNSYIRQIDKLGLGNAVKLWGSVSNVADLLQATDILAAPSLSEGFSFACLEAQASGLPCVISTGIPEEVIVHKNLVQRISLENEENWIEALSCPAVETRDSAAWKDIVSAGYDVSVMSKKTFELYGRHPLQSLDDDTAHSQHVWHS